jgi:murein DD-endopeptidase MepM/ murein hydrolase activator NlpD
LAEVYTVKKGDTLSAIAKKYNTTYQKLADYNDIPNPNYIQIGQKITIPGTSDTKPKTKSGTGSKVTINQFGLISDPDLNPDYRSCFVTWKWSNTHTENYKVMWYYDTGDSVWFVGNDGTTTYKQSTYSAPTNAKRVKVKIKPIAKTYEQKYTVKTKNKKTGKTTTTTKTKTVSYFTATWSSEKTYSFSNNKPEIPPAPTVEMDNYKLIADVNLSEAASDMLADHIHFEVAQDDQTIFGKGNAPISVRNATAHWTVTAGHKYKVRARAYRGSYRPDTDYCSEWSDFSSEVETIPAKPSGITTLKALSETSLYVAWDKESSATGYEIEYATEKSYLGASNASSTQTCESNKYTITGLESGYTYYVRYRATNSAGNSTWSSVKSVILGKVPAAPTTWSSTTTLVAGESLTLFWVHNAQDNSSQTYAQIEYKIEGGSTETKKIKNRTDEDEKDKTSSWPVDASILKSSAGKKFYWRVRTAGILKDSDGNYKYGEWSIQRVVEVYERPTLGLSLIDNYGSSLDTLESFPFNIVCNAGPKSQKPITYDIEITANQAYTGVDSVGNETNIAEGTVIFSKFYNSNEYTLIKEMSAFDVDLENNIEYKVHAIVSMDSGMTAEAKAEFYVSWEDEEYSPNAEIGINYDDCSATIRPFCKDEDDNLVENIALSIYRREFDGSFTEIMSGIGNSLSTFVFDMHPSLDYARYRIIAMSTKTGAVSYTDLPGYPVNEQCIIIQWSESWTEFNYDDENPQEAPPWSGSLIRLPYNIDVSEETEKDVTLVQYIGREHEVSYYGTQKSQTGTWNIEIERDDVDTLYELRRLSSYMGDVYVREPSGLGYWANIKVSISQKHRELTIPVTLTVTRVEGGA